MSGSLSRSCHVRVHARWRWLVVLGLVPCARPALAQAVADDSRLANGRSIVRSVCAACHSEQPPPKLAPPLTHIATRYREAVPDSAAAIARIVAWIRAPHADRSLMPKMARERWGLMPPLPLPETQLGDAALYVWTLSATAPGASGHSMHGRPHE